MRQKSKSMALGISIFVAIFGAGILSVPTYAAPSYGVNCVGASNDENLGCAMPPDENSEAVVEALDTLWNVYQAAITTHNDSYPDDPLKIIFEDNVIGPHYKPDSIKAAIPINTYVHMRIGRDKEASVQDNMDYLEGLFESLTTALTNQGFTSYPYTIQSYPPYYQYINNTTGVICAILTNGEAVSCGHINHWEMTDDWTRFVNGIGEAYYKKESKYPVVLRTDGNLPIHESEYEPYQYADPTIDVYQYLFYRESPTSNWVAFGSAGQAGFGCDEFTDEAQKGFAGYQCYDNDKSEWSKVSVTIEADEDSEEDSIKTPNTGASTKGEQNLIVVASASAISLGIIVLGLSRHLMKRQKAKVHFD